MVEVTPEPVELPDTNEHLVLALAVGKRGVIKELIIANDSGDTATVEALDGTGGHALLTFQVPPMYSGLVNEDQLPESAIFDKDIYFITDQATVYITATIDEM